MTFKRGFQANANKTAVIVREKLGLSATDPIDPWEICKHFDIEVIKMSNLSIDCGLFSGPGKRHFSAMTLSKGMKTCIVHNDWHSERRQRSNIAHELGHIFLGHAATPPLNDDGAREFEGGIEAEANFLGGCLLLPNEAAYFVLRKGLRPQSTLLYGISPAMLEYRLRISGAYIRHQRAKSAA